VFVALLPWVLVAAGRPLPLWAFVVVATVPLLPVVLWNGVGGFLFMTTATASRVASRTDNRWAVALTTVTAMLLPFSAFLVDEGGVGVVYFAFGNVFGVFIGILLRRADRLADELREANARLAEAAARGERSRIAQDVHDLVAHSLTVVMLHVGGSRRLIRMDPGAAEDALAEAERVGRESLDGIRGVVGLLRQDGETPAALSLDLDDLVRTYEAAGLTVGMTVRGNVQGLPLVVRVTVHRVVQEALANAARHAGASCTATVDIRVESSEVSARICNDLPQTLISPDVPRTGGFGLQGLAERVAAQAGTLTSGAQGRSWVVMMRMPRNVSRPVDHGASMPPEV
jgi:signal transduction histidine kinase